MKSSNVRFVLVTATILAALSLAVPLSAADFHGQIDNPLQNITAVDSFQTNGADMAGMSVTAFFSAAPSETVIWLANGAASGAATGPDTDWRLSEDGDTFSSPWTLEYHARLNKGLLTGFRIDGFAAGPGKIGVMFDRTFDGVFGTPGSFLGHDYETLAPAPPFDTFVVFQGAVGVAGDPPVGDEFRWLNVRFLVLPDTADEFTTVPPRISGLDGANLTTISFRQDTNNPLVPEPASLALVVGGAVLGLLRIRRAS